MFRHHGMRKHDGSHVWKVIGTVLGGLALAGVIGLVLGFLVRFLWNVTIAEIFNVSTISYWQAVGMFILAKLFFSMGGGGHHGKKHRPHKGHWKMFHSMGMGCDGNPDWSEDSQAFKHYWQNEGKEAFEEYMKNKKGNQANE